MVQILRTFALVASLVVPVAGGAHAQPASANDTARLLAGMQPSPDLPLLALTKEQAWQQYAKRFDAIFANIESRQLTRIRAWSQRSSRHLARYCSICSAGRTFSMPTPSFPMPPPT